MDRLAGPTATQEAGKLTGEGEFDGWRRKQLASCTLRHGPARECRNLIGGRDSGLDG
jgi:hypothetical protein